MTVYKKKSLKEWKNIINDSMPEGKLWNGIGSSGKNINTLLDCIAESFKQQENSYADRFNSLKLTKDSQFLDEYWDFFGISDYIKEKPQSIEKQYKIINAFAKARKGLFTAKKIEDFIKEVFETDINIYISDIRTSKYNNKFPCKFNFKFKTITKTDNTVVVKLPNSASASDDNTLPSKSMPFRLIDNDDFNDAIKMLLDVLLDVDLNIVYI